MRNQIAQTVGILLLHSTAVIRYYPSVMQENTPVIAGRRHTGSR